MFRSFIEKNFESEFFISASEAELYRHQLLSGKPIQLSENDYRFRLEDKEVEDGGKSDKSSDPFED